MVVMAVATDVGGLVGINKPGTTITASYATGNVAGGAGNGNDVGGVGGLVGINFSGTITASYATGAVDGGAGNGEHVGGLAGWSNTFTRITASYGFGTKAGGEIAGVDRSGDASPATGTGAVTSAARLTATNSSASNPAGTNDWSTRVWDFGSASQKPALKWVTGFDKDYTGTDDTVRYPCDQNLLPSGQRCGGIIPGQTR